MPTYKQSGQGFDTGTAIAAVTLGATPSIGNLIVCAFIITSIDNSIGYTLVDNQAGGGNMYTQIASVTLATGFLDGAGTLFIAYAIALKSSGTFTITLTKSTQPADYDVGLACVEYSGINQNNPNPNITNGASNLSGTTASPGAINAATVNTLYFTAVVSNNGNSASPLNSFNQRETANGSTKFINTADLVGSGSQTGSWTINALDNPALSLVAAFNPASGGIMTTNTGYWGGV